MVGITSFGAYIPRLRLQRDQVDMCLTHNLGGFPHENVAAVCIVGRDD